MPYSRDLSRFFSTKRLVIVCVFILTFSGCATFSSGIEGTFNQPATKNVNARPVKILIVQRHLRQTLGLDAIPKLENKYQIMNGFDDLLLDAMNEFSNVKRWSSFTEFSSDISDSKRLDEKDSLIASHDFVIRIEFKKEKSFVRYFLGTMGSTLSATLLPIPYTQDYYMNTDVFNANGHLLKHYERHASTTKWVELFLFPIYPFHTEKRKTEDIYVDFLHDVFRQIEAEQVLVLNQP